MLRRLARSLSFRLLAIFLVMGVLFAYGAVLGIRWVYATDQLRELVSGHLTLHVDYVRRDIGNPPNLDAARAITRKVPVDIRIAGPGLDWASDPAFPEPAELEFGGSDIFSGEASAWLEGLEDVEFATLGGHGFLKIDQAPFSIIVASPKINADVVERSLTPIIMGVGLLLVFIAYLAVRWLFKPIEAIRHGAAEIGRGNFQHRITAGRRDQLGDLADDINRMGEDVQRMLDAKRQLLLGISHELRSPLSRLRLALELAEDGEERRSLRQDVDEMEAIISTLLEAERLNTRHAALNVSRVSARELTDNLLGNFFSRERDRIRVDVPPELFFNVDEARITLLLKNLVSNALRYTRADEGPVEIEMQTAGNAWVIRVSDHGPGIAPEQIAYLGEPFYRGDPSRTRRSGGSGLGLYLARLIAEAHGGKLELDQGYTEGARFLVTLPFEPEL